MRPHHQLWGDNSSARNASISPLICYAKIDSQRGRTSGYGGEGEEDGGQHAQAPELRLPQVARQRGCCCTGSLGITGTSTLYVLQYPSSRPHQRLWQ